MDNDGFIFEISNSLDVTSKFSDQNNIKLEGEEEKKLNIFKSQFQPLIKVAEKKYIHDSLRSIFEKIDKSEHNKKMYDTQAMIIDKKVHKSKRTQSLDLERTQKYSEENTKHTDKHFTNGSLKNSFDSKNKLALLSDVLVPNEANQIKCENFDDSFLNEEDGDAKRSKPTNIFEREKYYENKKNFKLSKIKYALVNREQLNVKYTPGIDAGSLKIINKKLKNKKPIYERCLEIQKERKEKIENYKNSHLLNSFTYKNQEVLNDKSHLEDSSQNLFRETKDNNVENTEHFKEWQISNDKWSFKKEMKLQELKRKLEMEQLQYENSTFTPSIDQISDYLANLKSFNEFPGVDVYNKLYLQKEIKKIKQQNLIEKATPTFIPQTNKTIPKYLLTYKKNQQLNRKSNLYKKRKAEIELTLRQNPTKKREKNRVSLVNKMDSNDPNNKENEQVNNPDKTKTRTRGSSYTMRNNKKKGSYGKCDLTFFEQNEDNEYIFYN